MNRPPKPTIDQQIEEKHGSPLVAGLVHVKFAKDLRDTANDMRLDIQGIVRGRLNRAAAHIESLAADLLRYGDHASGCDIDILLPRDKRKCTCGWSLLKAKLEGQKEGD
jgi:hypothetical protein